MKNTKIVVSKKKIEEYSGELLVTFVTQGTDGETVGDPMFRPILKSLQQLKEFTGKKETSLLLYPGIGQLKVLLKSKRLMLLGLGDIAEISDPCEIAELLRTA